MWLYESSVYTFCQFFFRGIIQPLTQIRGQKVQSAEFWDTLLKWGVIFDLFFSGIGSQYHKQGTAFK